MLEQHLPVIDGGSERHHAGSENVCRAKLVDVDNTEATDNIWDEPVHLLKIANVIACQLAVRFGYFRFAQRRVAIMQLFGIEKFAGGCCGQFKSPRRINAMQFL